MKRITLASLLIISAMSNAMAATELSTKPAKQGETEGSVVTLEELMNPGMRSVEAVPAIREQMLREAGKTMGFQGGWINRSQLLKTIIESRASELDDMFQFSMLINKDGALPPVIVEARDVASFAPDQIRTASRVYRFERDERFVSVPPTWRDYLYVGLAVTGSVNRPMTEVLPENEAEKAIWTKAVKDGWEYGEKQAERILEANMNRLVRDYVGMLRFSLLMQHGMVTKTEVAESQQTVTGHSKEIAIGDTLKRMTKKAEFETDAKKWQPSIARSRSIIRSRMDVRTGQE